MTSRDRRAVALGGAALAAALLLFRVLPWTLRKVSQLHEEAVERSGTAQRAMEVLAHDPAVHDSLARVFTAILGLAPVLVEGHTATDAATTIAGIVSLTANQHNVKLVRVEVLPDSQEGVLDRVGVHAELECDLKGLTGFVRAIEVGQPLLTVATLSVTATDPAAHVEVLHVMVDVVGYFLPRGAT